MGPPSLGLVNCTVELENRPVKLANRPVEVASRRCLNRPETQELPLAKQQPILPWSLVQVHPFRPQFVPRATQCRLALRPLSLLALAGATATATDDLNLETTNTDNIDDLFDWDYENLWEDERNEIRCLACILLIKLNTVIEILLTPHIPT